MIGREDDDRLPLLAGVAQSPEHSGEYNDGRTAPAKVRRINSGEVELTIHEGRKHQVRRMLDEVGHRVESLERVAFGPLRLGNLPAGGHRQLTPAEVERLRTR